MKSIITVMIEEIYAEAIETARKEHQVLHGDGSDRNRGSYFITLRQLEEILKEYQS